MTDRKTAGGHRSAFGARLLAVLRERPLVYGSTALLLLGLSVLILLSYWQSPVVFGLALIHLAPALVVALTNLRCRLKGRPADWPRWLLIVSLLNALVAAVGLMLQAVFDYRIPDVPIDTSYIPLGVPRISVGILDVTTLLAIPVLIGTTVSGLFSALAHVLGRIPRLGTKLAAWLPAPTLYAWLVVPLILLLVFLQGDLPKGVLGGDSLAIVIAAFLGVICILAVLARPTLWAPGPVLLRWLPHLPAWTTLIFFLALFFQDSDIGIDAEVVGIGSWLVIVLTTPMAVLYWDLLRLRRSPVEPLSGGQSERAESIQSRTEHYIDLEGHSARLQASVRRSDGGVFGITGVRGAGKSALTRHLLAQFERDYFTLEVTAPVRHDPDLGFFTSVCRAVCRKTLDDLEPILHGKRAGAGGKLWQQIRNPALILLALVAILSLLQTQIGNPLTGTKLEEIVLGEGNWDEIVQDPLFENDVPRYFTLPIEAERRAVDRLLKQIDQALGEESDQDSSKTGYLLVPASDPGRFWLLRHTLKTDVQKALFAYRARLKSDYLLSPSRFLFSSLSRSQQEKWLWEIEKTPEDPSDIDESDLGGWAGRIFWAKNKQAAPFAHLSGELGFYLRSSADGEQEAQTKLVSELILEAFKAADPRLAFDVPRLRQFREVLRVYRQLLDGDVIPRSQFTPNAASPGFADLKDLPTSFRIAVAGILILIFAAPVWRTFSSLARTLANWRYLALVAEAEEFQEQLVYRSSRESSAGLSRWGLRLGRKQTLAARDLTLPGLTARYTDLLTKLRAAYNGKAVIAIDELDKIHDPEQVKGLLTEIKGALFVPGIFYLISISEDAARSFRCRLAAGRDIFESTFDEIIDIRQMGVASAVDMLERREGTGEDAEYLPRECLEVAALFGGGIPREIIRARRILSLTRVDPADRTRRWAARVLLAEELAQWKEHLGETNLSGTDTIKVREQACAAAECLQEGDNSEATYGKIWAALEPCIGIIDPRGLRNTVGYQTEGMEAETAANWDYGPVPKRQAVEYRRIAGDLQALLRLMILTHLSERIAGPGRLKKHDEDRILACHRALADKPALAEALLCELRPIPATSER